MRTSAPSTAVCAAARDVTFGKSSISRRGRSRDSVTPVGVELAVAADRHHRRSSPGATCGRARSCVATAAASRRRVGRRRRRCGRGRAALRSRRGAGAVAPSRPPAHGGRRHRRRRGHRRTPARRRRRPRRSRGTAASSTRIVLRLLRTRYSAARLSATRTRATPRPSAAVACSSRSAATSPFGSTRRGRVGHAALRRSTTSVSGSGRLTVYATGSVASITTAAPCAVTPSRRTGAGRGRQQDAAGDRRGHGRHAGDVASAARDQERRVCADALCAIIGWALSTKSSATTAALTPVRRRRIEPSSALPSASPARADRSRPARTRRCRR